MALLVFVCLVAMASAVPYQNTVIGGQQQVPQQVPVQGSSFQCTAVGYFPDPEDQSLFYRCVDLTETGLVLTKFSFTCPSNQVFVKTGQDGICIPLSQAAVQGSSSSGGGDGAYNPPVVVTTSQPPPSNVDVQGGGSYPSPDSAVPAQQPGQGPSVVAEVPTPAPVAPAPAPVVPSGGSYPQPGANNPVVATTAAPIVPAPGNSYPVPNACPAKYVQDAKYCNVYETCPSDGNKYRCEGGSVFDPNTQMCKFQSSYPRGTDICNGKGLMSEQLFRSYASVAENGISGEANLLVANPFQGPVQIFTHALDESSINQSPDDAVIPYFYSGRTSNVNNDIQNPIVYAPQAYEDDQPTDISINSELLSRFCFTTISDPSEQIRCVKLNLAGDVEGSESPVLFDQRI